MNKGNLYQEKNPSLETHNNERMNRNKRRHEYVHLQMYDNHLHYYRLAISSARRIIIIPEVSLNSIIIC